MFGFAWAGVTLSFASPAESCRFAPPTQHTLDPAEQGVDVTPPADVRVASFALHRGKAFGCSSCDDIGRVELSLVPTPDDRTDPIEMGYLVDVSPGAPVSIAAALQPVRVDRGAITLIWNDGRALVQEPLRFTISLTAVDLAGNVSANPTVVSIVDPPMGLGCRIHRGADFVPSAALLALLGFLRRRTRGPAGSRPNR